jgi:hypothetical protein
MKNNPNPNEGRNSNSGQGKFALTKDFVKIMCYIHGLNRDVRNSSISNIYNSLVDASYVTDPEIVNDVITMINKAGCFSEDLNNEKVLSRVFNSVETIIQGFGSEFALLSVEDVNDRNSLEIMNSDKIRKCSGRDIYVMSTNEEIREKCISSFDGICREF